MFVGRLLSDGRPGEHAQPQARRRACPSPSSSRDAGALPPAPTARSRAPFSATGEDSSTRPLSGIHELGDARKQEPLDRRRQRSVGEDRGRLGAEAVGGAPGLADRRGARGGGIRVARCRIASLSATAAATAPASKRSSWVLLGASTVYPAARSRGIDAVPRTPDPPVTSTRMRRSFRLGSSSYTQDGGAPPRRGHRKRPSGRRPLRRRRLESGGCFGEAGCRPGSCDGR